MPPVELLDPLEPVVELPELVGAAESGDLLLPQPVLVVIDVAKRQCALVKPKQKHFKKIKRLSSFTLKHGYMLIY